MRKYLMSILMVIMIATTITAQNYAYVVNGLAESLSRIDLESGQVNNHILLLGVVPNQIIYENQRLYVVNSLSPSLMIIDPQTNTLVDEIPMPVNSNPWNVAVNNDFAYVTGLATASVYVVNLNQRAIVDIWQVGQAPEGVLVGNSCLYVANTAFNPIDFTYGQGSVSILDLTDGQELERVNVGKNPQNLLIGPDGLLNVICTGDYVSYFGIIYFIDPWDMVVVDSLAMGGQPTVAVVNPAGIVYVAAGGWGSDGYIFSYNGNTHQVLHSSANPIEIETGVMGLALDSLGNIYAACQMADHVDKVNGDGSTVDTYSVGDGPSSIAIMDTRTSIETPPPAPNRVTLESVYPNPFNSSVNITVSGKNGSGDEIEIFDVNGRLVKKLSLAGKSSIYSKVTWNGLDFSGHEVASGVYFARLSGTSDATKMVLLR